MRRVLALLAVAVVLAGAVWFFFLRETKVTHISLVCRSGHEPVEPVRWVYSSKVDPSVTNRIPVALDITLHYTGSRSRAVPPVTTYFYRPDGAALRVASRATARLPPKGDFTYHVDTGGYTNALVSVGRGDANTLTFVIEVDGSYFGGLLSPPICGRWADHHIDTGKVLQVPDLRDKRPLNMAAGDWALVTFFPSEVMRVEAAETSTYAFFPAPIVATELKNEASMPDGVAKQTAEVGVTEATPTYSITVAPSAASGGAAGAGKGDDAQGVSVPDLEW